ncbi:MAG: MBL fold metallo-hydrolase [Thermoleophilia bacterium]|nr:MBL fold metallo-hydrolase [Thermoleophilia bacterium]
MTLHYRVFLHSYLGFNSNSTLFYGERDAVLIDATQLLSDAHAMAAEIIRMRKNLTHIYVSHFHPDHHFGLYVLTHAFPQARVVALPTTCKDIALTASDKISLWATDRFGPNDIPPRVHVPLPLTEPQVELEGEEILFFGGWEGDSIDNTVVWVPSLRVLCATDVAFHDCHLWPVESNVERRKKWRDCIRKLLDFEPRVIIPGHHDEAKLAILEEAERDTSRVYTDCVPWSLWYLDTYEEIYEQAKDGTEFLRLMEQHFGHIKAADFAVHWLARLLFPKTCPDWVTPLPGPPGKIFLNPEGGFDGDPPKE